MINRKHTGKPLLLVFPHNLLSHYLRCLVLTRELSRYYDVLMLESGDYSDFIKEEELETFQCASLDAAEMNRQFGNASFNWINSISLSAVLEDQIRVINDLQPDFVLGDASFTLKMAAEITGVPFISLMNGYMSKYYAEVRLPSRSFPGYQLMKQLPSHLLLPLVRYGEGLTFRLLHEPFNRIRKRYGLERKQQLLDELEGDINLLCDDPGIFPQEETPGNYFNIGPLFYSTSSARLNSSIITDHQKKTICISMGSTGSWDKLKFVGNEFFYRFNVIVAGDTENHIEGKSVIHVPFFDARQVFPSCELLICHGGNGSTYQALNYGVPVVCLTTHMEQDWNVQALEKHGLACSLNHLDDDQQIIEMVDEWLSRKTDSAFHAVSRRISEQVSRLPERVGEIAAFATEQFMHDGFELKRVL